MTADLQALRRRLQGRTPGLLGAGSSYAVLCPLTETAEGLSLLFEVRAKGLRQGGEVCFPGGRMEAGESQIQCALRETAEELSIPAAEVEVLGLTDFICNQRGFLLHPVLGIVSAAGMAALRPSPAEVAEAFAVPVRFFRETPPVVRRYALVPQIPGDFPYEAAGVAPDYPWASGEVEVPIWRWGDRPIWGMTARIVRDIVKML